MSNDVIDAMMNRKSIRKYTDQMPSEEVLEAVIRAGQQAPFAAQLCSVMLTRRKGVPFGAPLLFTICVDLHRMELVMEKRGWKTVTNDLSLSILWHPGCVAGGREYGHCSGEFWHGQLLFRGGTLYCR